MSTNNNRIYVESSITYRYYTADFWGSHEQTGKLNDYLGAKGTDLLG